MDDARLLQRKRNGRNDHHLDGVARDARSNAAESEEGENREGGFAILEGSLVPVKGRASVPASFTTDL
jgi:hypothetical protein